MAKYPLYLLILLLISCSGEAQHETSNTVEKTASETQNCHEDTLNKYLPELTGKLKREQANNEDIKRFIDLFTLYSNLKSNCLDKIELGERNAPGDMYLKITELAKQGNTQAAIAILKSSISWYGNTVEGSEFHSELLWDIYSNRTSLILNSLASLEPKIRKEIIDKEFRGPLLDYDYRAILDSLNEYQASDSFKSDFNLLKSYLEANYESN